MAWHCVVKHCITQHCNAKHGIAPRGLGRSEVSAPCSAPWAPRKAPHEAGLMESTRWLCFQHRLLKAETGLPPDTSSKRRRPKVGGAFCGPKTQRIDTGCVITCDVFFWWSFSRFGAYLEGRETPALQREHVLEQPEAQKWGQRCSGSKILKDRKESECQKHI